MQALLIKNIEELANTCQGFANPQCVILWWAGVGNDQSSVNCILSSRKDSNMGQEIAQR